MSLIFLNISGLLSCNLASRPVFALSLASGTVLKAAQYFDDSTPIPPTLAFGLGSLGFLAPFDPEQSQSMISRCDAAVTSWPLHFCCWWW